MLSVAATPFYEVNRPDQGAAPLSSSPSPYGYQPSQILNAYGFNQLSFSNFGNPVPANGSGETIAIVDAYNDPNIANDLQAFDWTFGLPGANLTVLNQYGGTALPGVDPSGGWEMEESLDVEWAHAIAPGANILLLEANSSNFSDLLAAAQTAAAYPGVAAVSMSWGGSEFNGETLDNSMFTTPAGHSGVVFVGASGDSGAPVSFPAVSPNVLSVGGTSLSLSSLGNYQGESAWSSSGGGISAYEPRPSYQPSTYSNGFSAGTSTMRMNPDVAYDANPGTGFAVYDSYNFGVSAPWEAFGGTSDAAPQWAALIAITDQGRALQGESALDGPSQLLPMLYRLPGDFHDIAGGTTGGSPNYAAGPGYDLTTGLGTPIANSLVPDLIFSGAARANFVGTDTWTEGSWQGLYGKQAYNIIDNGGADPGYAQLSASGNSSYIWNTASNDPRALEELGSPNRIAAVWYSFNTFTVNMNLTDGQTHQLALYLLDWDQWHGGRSEQVQIVNAVTGQVLSTQNVSNFAGGEYLVYNVSGDIDIRITNLNPFSNAVLNGLFLDPAAPLRPAVANATANYVGTNPWTQGGWQGIYGSQGHNVIGNNISYPSYAQISASGNSNYIWSTTSNDPRALEEPGSPNRIAAVWYSFNTFTVNMNLTDGQTHQLALYLLDWDQWHGGRSEQVQIINAVTGQVLSTQDVSNFAGGDYLVYNVAGNIDIQITNLNPFSNAVLNGLFLG